MRYLSPISFFVSITLSLAIVGCSPASKEASSGATLPSEKRGVIGVSLLTLQNPFFKVIGDNIVEEGKKNGYETIIVSADNDVSKQGNQVKDFIVKKVNAIVLSPCDPKSIVPIIQEANTAGIPVFTVDIPCPDPSVKIVTQIATDNYGGGKEAGKAMIEALGGNGGKVAILHFKQAQSCILRVQGFREAIDAHNVPEKEKSTSLPSLKEGEQKMSVIVLLKTGFKLTQTYEAFLPSTIPLHWVLARRLRRPTKLIKSSLSVLTECQRENKRLRKERSLPTPFNFLKKWGSKLFAPLFDIRKERSYLPRFSFLLSCTQNRTVKRIPS